MDCTISDCDLDQLHARTETQVFAKAKADELLAANTAILRLKKEIEGLQQEAFALEAKRHAQRARHSQQILECGKVCYSQAYFLCQKASFLATRKIECVQWCRCY